MATIYLRSITTRKLWLVGWAIGIVALIVLTLGFYPSFRDQADEFNEVVDKMPESIKSLIGMGGGVEPLSPVGYLSHEIFAFVLPSILMIAAIGLASGIAGDEEHGLLETVYSLPISRRRLMAERIGAIASLLAFLSLVACTATLVMSHLVDLGVPVASVAWATLTAYILTLAVGSVSLVVGGWTGRRGASLATATTVAIAGYIITSLAEAGIEFFRAVRFLSVFSLYNVVDVLQTGMPRWSLLGLVGVTTSFGFLAIVGIERRDLRAG